MNKKRIRLLALVLIVPFFLQAQSKKDFETIEKLDKKLSQMTEDWETPGMAVAIFKGDSVILSKGYGYKNIDTEEKVDKNTIFPVASITKTFTASAIGVLVDEGKLKLDDKVRDYLPWFELYSPYASENMTIRDLLCHRSGLETFSGDLLWNASTFTTEEVVRKAKYLEPKYGFREHFGYSNIMFIAAGEVIEAVTGMEYPEYIQKTFLDPLGMERTLTSVSMFENTDNVVTAHINKNDEIITVPFLNWDNIGAAGLLNSSVQDMTQWMRLHLNNGTLDGEEYVSEDFSDEMWQAHTPQSVSKGSKRLWPSTHFKAYALGWGTDVYHGYKTVGHGGGYDGILSYFGLVPEEDLGFVVLTNSGSMLYYATRFTILDAFLAPESTETKNWSDFMMDFHERRQKQEKKETEKLLSKKDPSLKPTHELEAYTGTYSGPMYGDAEVTIKDGKLHVQLVPSPRYYSTLEHLRHNTFIIELKEFPRFPPGTCNFVLDKYGEPKEMKISIPNPDFYFEELKFIKQ
ncbi:MAG: serine hydrolase [Bacteroidales bacterium]